MLRSLKSRIALAAAAALFCFSPAQAKTLVGVGIAGSNDHVYFWYADGGGQVSSGTSGNPTAYRSYYNFPGNAWGKLVGTGITRGDRVHYWWEHAGSGAITVTVGTSSDPDKYGVNYGFNERSGWSLITAAIAKSNDRVYYYWKNNSTGAVSVTRGTSVEPEAYGGNTASAATTLVTHDLVDVAIARNDHVYFWWRNKATGVITVTSGTSTNPFAYRPNHYVSGL